MADLLKKIIEKIVIFDSKIQKLNISLSCKVKQFIFICQIIISHPFQ